MGGRPGAEYRRLDVGDVGFPDADRRLWHGLPGDEVGKVVFGFHTGETYSWTRTHRAKDGLALGVEGALRPPRGRRPAGVRS